MRLGIPQSGSYDHLYGGAVGVKTFGFSVGGRGCVVGHYRIDRRCYLHT